jgi:uncharacterized protein (UPF0303 family)
MRYDYECTRRLSRNTKGSGGTGKKLQFSEFTNETALTLGLTLVEKARHKEKGVTIDITRNRQQLFHYAFPGTRSLMINGLSAKIRW